MTRLAAALVLVLGAGCVDAGRPAERPERPTPPVTARPTTTTRAPSPVEAEDTLVYATDTDLWALPPGGSPQRLTAVSGITDLDVSADGRYVAVMADEQDLTVYDLSTGRTSGIDGIDAGSIGVWGDGFVAVAVDALVLLDPELVIDNGTTVDIPLPDLGVPRYLASTRDRLLVAATEGGPFGPPPPPEVVYDIARDGTPTRLFRDGDGVRGGGERIPMGIAGLSADGNTLVYGTGVPGPACNRSSTVAVRDLKANREVRTSPPRLNLSTEVASVTADADGRTVVGFTSDVEGCLQRAHAGAYALDGTTWKQFAEDARWAARGPGGRLATLSNGGDLRVDGRLVERRVALAVWSPV